MAVPTREHRPLFLFQLYHIFPVFASDAEKVLAYQALSAGLLLTQLPPEKILTPSQRRSLVEITLSDDLDYNICFGWKETSYQWSMIQNFISCAEEVRDEAAPVH